MPEKEGLIHTNPCASILLPKGKNKTGRSLTPEEREISLVQLLNSKITANMVQLAFNSGLRISEITALRWKDIDYKKDLFMYSIALKEYQLKSESKNFYI